MNSSSDSRNGMSRALGVAALLLALACAALPARAASAADGYGFELTDVTSGDKLDQATLCADKPLVVLVWSPLCPHCQRHMPYFAGFYNKADHGAVNIVSIAVDCTQDEARQYVKNKSLEFPVLWSKSGKTGDAFYKQGWPTTFVFAKGGAFVGYCDSTGPGYINDMLALVDKAARD
jgi:thiol-disulfide isomerase/thioredoxin